MNAINDVAESSMLALLATCQAPKNDHFSEGRMRVLKVCTKSMVDTLYWMSRYPVPSDNGGITLNPPKPPFSQNVAEETMNKVTEFFQLYRLYKQCHPRIYAARIAYGIAFRGLPF